jgi:hypothetical protein
MQLSVKLLLVMSSLLFACGEIVPVNRDVGRDAGPGDAAVDGAGGSDANVADAVLLDADSVVGQDTYVLTWECSEGCGIAGSGAPLSSQDRLTVTTNSVRFWRASLADGGYSGPAVQMANEIHVSSLDTTHTYESIVITVEGPSLTSCIAWTGYPGPGDVRRAWCFTGRLE